MIDLIRWVVPSPGRGPPSTPSYTFCLCPHIHEKLMNRVQYLTSYSFPIADCGLATLSIRVDELANRLGFPVLEWLEDGLGPTRGFAVRLSSGRVYVLKEHLLSIKYSYTKGPNIVVDAAGLARLGVVTLLAEFLVAMDLARTDVSWMADRSYELEAEKLVTEFEMRTLELARDSTQ